MNWLTSCWLTCLPAFMCLRAALIRLPTSLASRWPDLSASNWLKTASTASLSCWSEYDISCNNLIVIFKAQNTHLSHHSNKLNKLYPHQFINYDSCYLRIILFIVKELIYEWKSSFKVFYIIDQISVKQVKTITPIKQISLFKLLKFEIHRIIQKLNIEMVYGNETHPKSYQTKDRTHKAQNRSLKQMFFEIISAHINQNATLSPIPYYLLSFIQCLALMWFVIHPALQLYASSDYFITQINLALKAINFYQYMADQPNQYPVIVIAAFSYLIVECGLILISGLAVIKKNQREAAKYLKKIVNILFLITVKVLSGPLIGLFVTVIYCDNVGPYHKGEVCYSPTHILYCCLVGIIFLIVLGHILLFATLYSIRNPFSGSFLAEPSRYHVYSKSVIKFICPLYFALKSQLGLQSIYEVLVPVLLGALIFFHRLFSVHTYKHSHFYLEYMMEGVLLWVAVNSALIYYIQVIPVVQQLSFVYVLLTSLMVGYILVNIQKWYQNIFIEECLEGQIKKQNLDKFMLSLIDCFLHKNIQQGKIIFKVYSKIIHQNNHQNQKDNLFNNTQDNMQNDLDKIVHKFLLQQLQIYLKQSNSVILKIMRCYLLSFLGFKNSCFHQSLQLEQQRLSLIDQFAVFYFRKSTKCSYELPYRDSPEYISYFKYKQQVNLMQQLMEECALKNIEYWEQLCESDPSLPKLRNLATLYIEFSNKIAQQYSKVSSIMPNCLSPITHYLDFLVNIGVDVRDTMKIRELIKSRLQNKQGLNIVLGGRLRQQDLHMITVDTVGNNLGIIKNCSTQIKELLGYDKKLIINKQITKIMPKIYTQFHNKFILDYIHQSKPSTSQKDIQSSKDLTDHPEKIVTPMNIQNLLVEVGLSLQMYTAFDSSLVMGGVLRKRARGQESLIMVQGLTGQILGIDKNFAKLMRQKITGKQIVQQQIRLSAYLPQINIEQIESQGFQNTLLQIGHLLEQENMRNLKLNVRVELRQVKHYKDHKIVFLNIIESVASQNASSMNQQGSKIQSLAAEFEMIDFIYKKQQLKQNMKNLKGTEVSISFSDRQLETKNYQDLADEVPMARKLDDYIQMKQSNKLSIFNNLCYILVVSLLFLSLVITFFVHNDYLNKIGNIYKQMQLISDIPYQQAFINLNINKIWSSADQNYKPGNLSAYKSNLKTAVFTLSSSLTQVIKATQNYNYALEYNQQNFYTVSIFKAVNQTIISNNDTMKVNDAFQNYFTSSRLFMNIDATINVSAIYRLIFTQHFKYISFNGDYIIPSIAQNVIIKFGAYFTIISQAQINTILFSKGGLMAFSIICLIGGLIFGKYLNKTNQQVLDFYHLIRLWDVCQMAYKCDQYLKSHFKTIRKQRASSLLKIFPFKTFVDIIQIQKGKGDPDTPAITRNSQILQRYGHLQSLQTDEKHFGQQKQEDTLIKKENLVKIQWQENHQKSILAVSIVLITIIAIIGVSMYFYYVDMKKLESSFKLLKNIGIVRKNLIFLSVYAYKISEGLDLNDYYRLISNQVNSFYRYSDLTFNQLGDSVFKNVYAQTELIQKYFTAPNATTLINLSNMYKTSINQILSNATESILNLDRTVFKPHFDQLIENNRQQELTMKIIYGIMGIFALMLMHFCYIKPIKVHRRYTINMLRMLPSWILQRTPQAIASINK